MISEQILKTHPNQPAVIINAKLKECNETPTNVLHHKLNTCIE